MYIYIHIPVDTCWRRLMMVVVPSTGMVVIMMIVMGLVTARQGKGHDEAEKPNATKVLYFVFHA
jgi:hypothetical protein